MTNDLDRAHDLMPHRPISAVDSPLRRYLGSLSAGSRRAVLGRLRKALTIAGVENPDPVAFPWHTLTLATCAEIRDRLDESELAPSTVNAILSALKGIARWAWRLEQLDGETLARIDDLDGVRGSTPPTGRALDAEEIRELLESCHDTGPAGIRDAVAICVLYGAGLRRAEAVALDLQDFRPGSPAQLVVRNGKGGKSALVPLPDAAARTIVTWLRIRGDEPGPLLVRCTRGRHGRLQRRQGDGELLRVGDGTIGRALKRRAASALLDDFSAHDLRRSYITNLLDVGVQLEIVQRCARHSNPTTTVGYDRRPFQEQERAAQRLPLADFPGNFTEAAVAV